MVSEDQMKIFKYNTFSYWHHSNSNDPSPVNDSQMSGFIWQKNSIVK